MVANTRVAVTGAMIEVPDTADTPVVVMLVLDTNTARTRHHPVQALLLRHLEPWQLSAVQTSATPQHWHSSKLA